PPPLRITELSPTSSSDLTCSPLVIAPRNARRWPTPNRHASRSRRSFDVASVACCARRLARPLLRGPRRRSQRAADRESAPPGLGPESPTCESQRACRLQADVAADAGRSRRDQPAPGDDLRRGLPASPARPRRVAAQNRALRALLLRAH